MKIFTTNNSTAMANAEAAVYDHFAPHMEQRVFSCADETMPDYRGGSWEFHSDGEIGFWVPTGAATFFVSCPGNGYENSAMPAIELGVALTLLAINRGIWFAHSKGLDFSLLASAQRNLEAFAYGDDSTLDVGAIYGFLD
jgi:hypothetical protein